MSRLATGATGGGSQPPGRGGRGGRRPPSSKVNLPSWNRPKGDSRDIAGFTDDSTGEVIGGHVSCSIFFLYLTVLGIRLRAFISTKFLHPHLVRGTIKINYFISLF